MNRTVRLGVFAVLGLLALALLLSPAIGQQPQAQDPQPGTGARADRTQSAEPPAVYPEEEPDTATFYLQIPGSALRPENSADVESAVDVNYPGCIYAESGNVYGFFSAPIYPPSGARLTMVRVYVYDASQYDTFLELAVLRPYGDEQDVWVAGSSGSGGYSSFVIDIPDHVVDYSLYSYIFRWLPSHLGTDIKVCNIRLYYVPATRAVYIPDVARNGP